MKTTEDFGVQGDNPSHPELLDWLATEFVRSGWDVKRMQKLIVTSATYRQSSKLTPQLIARDPENRLLARGPRFRVDAEAVRDTALFVSGLARRTHRRQSGEALSAAGLVGSGVVQQLAEVRAGQWREPISPQPLHLLETPKPAAEHDVFDAPTREYCVVRRPRTNTPLQALALMNDPQFVEASRAFAQRMMTEGGKDAESRIAFAFRLATGRKITKDESKVLLDVFKQQLADYQGTRKPRTSCWPSARSKRNPNSTAPNSPPGRWWRARS